MIYLIAVLYKEEPILNQVWPDCKTSGRGVDGFDKKGGKGFSKEVKCAQKHTIVLGVWKCSILSRTHLKPSFSRKSENLNPKQSSSISKQ